MRQEPEKKDKDISIEFKRLLDEANKIGGSPVTLPLYPKPSPLNDQNWIRFYKSWTDSGTSGTSASFQLYNER